MVLTLELPFLNYVKKGQKNAMDTIGQIIPNFMLGIKNLMNININFRQCGWDNLYHRMLVRNDHSINLEKIENFLEKILKKTYS